MVSRTHSVPPASETFLVYPENRFAYTAMTFDSAPMRRESTIVYVFGPSGVGKSHLVRHALRVAIRAESERRVGHWTGSEFAANLAAAAQNGLIAEFQESCRRLDTFILEDLHALERRPETQNQLVAIFDALRANGCRIILTSRKPPGELANFSPRFVNRCHAAILAHMKLPSRASRQNLLAHFATAHQIPIPEDVIALLADAFPSSPRELSGVIVQLEHRALREQKRIDLNFAKRCLSSEVRPPQLTLNEIAKSVAQHFCVSLAKLRSKARLQQLVLPRQCAMFLARELTGQRLGQIGHYFGDRDHSTVVHSCARFQQLLGGEPDIRQHLTQIRSHLGVE